MFHNLIESGAQAPRRPGWIFTSAGTHATLVGLAIAITLRDPPVRVERVQLEDLVFTVPRELAPAQLPRRESGSGAPDWLAPSRIPIAIPDIPEMSFPIDAPLRLAPGDTVGSGLLRDAFLRRPLTDHIYLPHLVERAAVARSDNPQPEYPPTLRRSQIEGEVLVQFVVDTTGRAEPQSIVILRATHPAFGESVRRWLVRTRYSPAEVSGRPVRQLVQQMVGFTLRP